MVVTWYQSNIMLVSCTCWSIISSLRTLVQTSLCFESFQNQGHYELSYTNNPCVLWLLPITVWFLFYSDWLVEVNTEAMDRAKVYIGPNGKWNPTKNGLKQWICETPINWQFHGLSFLIWICPVPFPAHQFSIFFISSWCHSLKTT